LPRTVGRALDLDQHADALVGAIVLLLGLVRRWKIASRTGPDS